MEHIKNILAARRTSLFTTGSRSNGRGSGEWSAFNTIRGDQTEMFPVATPRNRETPRYSNIVPIRRYRTA
ncbi:hypothetical protein A3C20_02970 [Candidatus Kaiserbacteria bacterium RIFCSPHIGHO2_02_FULL_55_25]|uniref:Uncharacterized protein n=1 Tax=Candidatus Kaiserbacteria bacterium RIFCSPHIGHO2_02_FULL_55_25 TaxID=1798498 RepID=A0A1F6E6I0_9BACT|nr:MAG: hypothetical protein A2764_01105 [Candidatus Kaiserbacteria bacterium RIFCSPHIGHO2_01_FULL_55_79]OGG69231.1 MAG: hypothetical protein A3C20_02970 [Candidatus Kaiserbacteria bacterium RIFCSPHIGHO2_02_FULL_55_25]OGG78662.1 MAG: hypothetical protein A3F56_03485 [Candidatus Kaiserbacteria bacterium RIFCSPHIGHO2_12_FULL_55_13]OGG83632.1 MAG: hypothetical protein A3A42_00450 [Candidatus Kaiserbacteria bacterium RIFCSPLOWO2_01_FULL_55_25]